MAEKAAAPARKGRHPKLTEETQAAIVEALSRGAFDHVAASAAGIAERTFRYWMERGAEAASGIYHDFYAAVSRARAEARLEAEARVYETDPYKWLRFGPGRDRPGAPGWTDGEASGPMTEITQGDLVIKTFWGRASDGPPPRRAEQVDDDDEALQREGSREESESDASQ